jgi:putative Mn2+ efflux pump MntP
VIETIALSIGLAMDATAMSAVRGLQGRSRELWLLPLLFGVFQAGMSAIGWAAGAWGGHYIEAWDHWIAFGLLAGIGLKMLIDAWRSRSEKDDAAEEIDAGGGLVILLGLALATSIDAAAAGLTLPLLPVAPWISLGLIGFVTFAFSVIGFVLGKTAGKWLGSAVTAVGGVILIAIGVRILVQHTS